MTTVRFILAPEISTTEGTKYLNTISNYTTLFHFFYYFFYSTNIIHTFTLTIKLSYRTKQTYITLLTLLNMSLLIIIL